MHDLNLKRNKIDRMFVANFHPTNEDVTFMFCNRDIYKYKIGQRKYKKFEKLPFSVHQKHRAYELTECLCKCTLVHPLWPTLIPSFQRKRKKDALSSPEDNTSLKRNTREKENGSLKPQNSSLIIESSRENQLRLVLFFMFLRVNMSMHLFMFMSSLALI